MERKIYQRSITTMDLEKVDLLQKVVRAVGPKMEIDREILKNLMAVLVILSDQETGDSIKRLIKEI